MIEDALILIKPDAVEQNLIGKILAVYEEKGLKITRLCMHTVSAELASRHYAEHQSRHFYNDLISYITRSPVVSLILTGDNAVAKVREINGATDPKKAAPGTIRALYGRSIEENCVHASDSLESAERELKIWFPV